MSESRLQALERLLADVDRFDFFTPQHESDKALVADVTSVLLPFMQNPDRHSRHVSVILEYMLLASAIRAFQPLLKIYKIPFPFIRRIFETRLKNVMLQPLKARVQAAKDEVLAAVDPGELKIDLLPIASIAAKVDWKKQGRRLVLLETRGVVLPTTGMQLRAISHQIQITSPVGCQFVDTIPSNEMEILGQREVSITERGKFVYTEGNEAKVSAELSGAGAKVAGAASYKDSLTTEEEAIAAAKVTHAPQVARIISSAVGNTAIWQLLRTPTQLLLGSNKFVATALVPTEAKRLALTIRYGAEIEGWGPTSIQNSLEVDVPPSKG